MSDQGDYGGGYSDEDYSGTPGEDYGTGDADQSAAYEAAAEAYVQDGAAALVAAHPELAEEANAEALIVRARQVAEAAGNPTLATDPSFWAVVYEGKVDPPDPRSLADQIVDGGPPGYVGKRCLPF
jgi:hypothetical protein